MKLDYHKLLILKEIYRQGSVSKAALELDLSQASVSYTLEQLRDAFEDPLFVKLCRGIVPTVFLSRRMDQIQRFLADMESLPRKKEFSPHDYSGQATILANVTELLPSIQAFSTEFRRQVPNARLRLLELGSRDKLLESFDSLRPHFAITAHLRT